MVLNRIALLVIQTKAIHRTVVRDDMDVGATKRNREYVACGFLSALKEMPSQQPGTESCVVRGPRERGRVGTNAAKRRQGGNRLQRE